MAASKLDQIAEELLCSVCFEDFKNPKLLDCNHMLCLKCLQQIEAGGKITCPLCNGKTTIKTGQSIRDLPEPLIIKQLQELVAKPEKPEPVKTCEICDENEALWLCQVCVCCMCNFCQEIHKSGWGKEHSHERLTQNSFCHDHPSKRVSGYCNQCSKVVCIKCAATVHSEHDVVTLEQVYEQRITELKHIKETTSTRISVLNTRVADVRHDQQQITRNYSDVERQLLEIQKSVVDRLNTEVAHLQQEHRAELKKMEIFERELDLEKNCAETLLGYVDDLLVIEVPAEVLSSVKPLPGQTTPSSLPPKLRTPKLPRQWTTDDIDKRLSDLFQNIVTYDTYRPSRKPQAHPDEVTFVRNSTVSVAGAMAMSPTSSPSTSSNQVFTFEHGTQEGDGIEEDILGTVLLMVYDEKEKVVWIRNNMPGRNILWKCRRNREAVAIGPLAGSDAMQRGVDIDTKRDYLVTTVEKGITALSKQGQEVRRLALAGDASCIVYNADLDWYVAAGHDKLFCVDAERQVPIHTIHAPQEMCADLDARSVVTVSIGGKPHFLTTKRTGDGSKISIFQKGGSFLKDLKNSVRKPGGMCVSGECLLVCDMGDRQVIRLDLKPQEGRRVFLSPEQLQNRLPLAISVTEDQTTFVLVVDETGNGLLQRRRLVAFPKSVTRL